MANVIIGLYDNQSSYIAKVLANNPMKKVIEFYEMLSNDTGKFSIELLMNFVHSELYRILYIYMYIN